MKQLHQKHHKFVKDCLDKGDYETTEGGILIHGGIMASGIYYEGVRGKGDRREHKNLVPTEGINYLLGVALGGVSVAAGFYLAPFSGATAPAATWAAANFASTASEITSTTNGFSQTTRPAWTPGSVSSGSIDNLSAEAAFNVVTTTSVTITGAALLTNNTRGGTSGSLISATAFSASRLVYSGDVWDCGYRITLTAS